MKKNLFLAILVLVGCGKKSDDEPTCQENRYQSQCKNYLAAEVSNQTLPTYPGCLEAYKFGADGKGSGKLFVMPAEASRLPDMNFTYAAVRMRLILDGVVVKEIGGISDFPGSFKSLAYFRQFDIEEGKEYIVKCDEILKFNVERGGDPHEIVGATSIKSKLINGVDSPRNYFGCHLDSEREDKVSLSFPRGDNIEKVVIKRNGEIIREITERYASTYDDETFREIGKDYKYSCDAVIGGQVQLGAFSVTVKKDK